MKKSILSVLLLFILTNSFSQDLIVTSVNDSINCLIEYTSNKKIAFKTLNSNKEFENKFIKIESVLDYKYDFYADINSKKIVYKDSSEKVLPASSKAILYVKDSIRKESGAYYLGNLKLSGNELISTLNTDSRASLYTENAKNNLAAAKVFSYIGGSLIGWPLGRAMAGAEDPQWNLAAIGGGSVLLAVIFNGVANKELNNAIYVFNKNRKNQTTSYQKIKLDLDIQINSVGMTLKF